MKIYSVIVSLIAILAVVIAGLFYSQNINLKTEVKKAQDQQRHTEGELQRVKNDYAKGIQSVKIANDILKSSLESFLVPGDVKSGTIGSTEAKAVAKKIKKVSDNMDRISLEKGWEDFQTSSKISDYLAFERNLTNNMERNLNNIH